MHPVRPSRTYRLARSELASLPALVRGVYELQLDGVTVYVGNSRDIRRRLLEHDKGLSKVTGPWTSAVAYQILAPSWVRADLEVWLIRERSATATQNYRYSRTVKHYLDVT